MVLLYCFSHFFHPQPTLCLLDSFCHLSFPPESTYGWAAHTVGSLESRFFMYMLVFSCDQATLRTLKFRPSVCLSAVTPFWQCSCHRIILKFSGVITFDRRDIHAKGQGQRSKVKVTEVMTSFGRFRTVTPVWLHIWRWNDAQSCLGEVPYCFSRSFVKFQGHRALKIVEFDPDWACPDCNSSLNSPMAMKWCKSLK